MEDKEEEVIEITSDLEEKVEEIKEEMPTKKKKEKKKLTKNQKIILVFGIIVLVLVIAGVVIYLNFFSGDDKKIEAESPGIVIEKNNYRYDNGNLVFLDNNDKEIGTYECDNKTEENCKTAYYSPEEDLLTISYVNEEEESFLFDVPVFNNKYAFIIDNSNGDNKEIKLYDLTTNEVIGVYTDIKMFDSNKVYLKNEDGLYGLVSLEEEFSEVIAFEYTRLGHINGTSLIRYEKDGTFGLLDFTGDVKASGITNEIVSYYNESIIAVGADGNYRLVDKSNNSLLDDSFDYIKFDKNYVYLFSGDELYVRNSNLSRLNEEPIEVNDKYEEYVMYDENLKVVEEKSIIEVDTSDINVVKIIIDDEETKLNPNEARISEKYDYISYLDGIIYIYEEEDKKTLEGTYECENVNVTTTESSSFSKCFIATESKLLNRDNAKDNLGFIPIYNDEYIFINDNTKIMMYNYKSEVSYDKIPKYSKVDVGYYNADNDVIKASADNLIIMAHNLAGEAGLIKLNSTGASKVLNFDYATIEIFKTGYLTKTEEGSYDVFDNIGNQLTNENTSIKNEIVDYNDEYIKVKTSDNKYQVYSLTGQVISNSLIDVTLGDDVYVGIVNDELEVYKYSDPKKNILGMPVSLVSNNYEFVEDSSGITIKVLDSDKKVVQTYSFDSDGAIK